MLLASFCLTKSIAAAAFARIIKTAFLGSAIILLVKENTDNERLHY